MTTIICKNAVCNIDCNAHGTKGAAGEPAQHHRQSDDRQGKQSRSIERSTAHSCPQKDQWIEPEEEVDRQDGIERETGLPQKQDEQKKTQRLDGLLECHQSSRTFTLRLSTSIRPRPRSWPSWMCLICLGSKCLPNHSHIWTVLASAATMSFEAMIVFI